jgi:hypothetical protein
LIEQNTLRRIAARLQVSRDAPNPFVIMYAPAVRVALPAEQFKQDLIQQLLTGAVFHQYLGFLFSCEEWQPRSAL